MLGIAKLLPQIVPVKRETLQVVSLAMTGLMLGSDLIFHTVENMARARFVQRGQESPFLGLQLTARAGVAVDKSRNLHEAKA